MTGHACLALDGQDKFGGDRSPLAQPVADNLLGAAHAPREFRLVLVNGSKRAPECFVAHVGENTTQLYILQQLNCTGSSARIFVPITPMRGVQNLDEAREAFIRMRKGSDWSSTELARAVRERAQSSGGMAITLTQQAISKFENGGYKSLPPWYQLAMDIMSGDPTQWPPADVIETILEVAAFPLSQHPTGEHDLPVFAHAVAAVLQELAIEPSKAGIPDFRAWAAKTAVDAIANYRQPPEQSAGRS